MKPLIAVTFAASIAAQTWTLESSGTTASLRGLHAVNARVVWASGTKGTFLRTMDGGTEWHAAQVNGAGDLDFRDVHAISDRVAWLMSAGSGDKSRIYKTEDGGEHWTLQFANPDAKGFFDSIAFRDGVHGILVGDPVDGRFVIFTTADGGDHWSRQTTPPAEANEGAFAASGTAVFVEGKQKAWFVTGGAGGARVFRSADGGRSWTAARTPIRNEHNSTGIFSIGFDGRRHGVAVGGDYANPAEPQHNVALSDDGGRTWKEPARGGPQGFRSAVTHVRGRIWIAAGTSGSDISRDGGATWTQFDKGSFNAVSFASTGEGWAAGAQGRIARFANSPVQ